MKKISRKISYSWWKINGEEIPDRQNLLDELDYAAADEISGKLKRGYIEGEMFCWVGEVQYRGYWSISNN